MSTDPVIRATAAEAMAVLADVEHWLGLVSVAMKKSSLVAGP